MKYVQVILFAMFPSILACEGGDDDPGPDPGCGDGTCSGAETCSSCSTDCGACSTTCDPVADPPACSGDEICVPASMECEYAFDRGYEIWIWGVSLPQYDPAGLCWDEPTCDAPDPFVEVWLDGNWIFSTQIASNTFDPGFGEQVSVSVLPDTSLQFVVYDQDDLSENDLAFSCAWDPLLADYLRSGSLLCEGLLGTLGATIQLL